MRRRRAALDRSAVDWNYFRRCAEAGREREEEAPRSLRFATRDAGAVGPDSPLRAELRVHQERKEHIATGASGPGTGSNRGRRDGWGCRGYRTRRCGDALPPRPGPRRDRYRPVQRCAHAPPHVVRSTASCRAKATRQRAERTIPPNSGSELRAMGVALAAISQRLA